MSGLKRIATLPGNKTSILNVASNSYCPKNRMNEQEAYCWVQELNPAEAIPRRSCLDNSTNIFSVDTTRQHNDDDLWPPPADLKFCWNYSSYHRKRHTSEHWWHSYLSLTLFFILRYMAESFSFKLTVMLVKLAVTWFQTELCGFLSKCVWNYFLHACL